MSMFGQDLGGYRFNNCEMPGWARAERYEYCEPLFAENGKPAKRRVALVRLMLSAFAGVH